MTAGREGQSAKKSPAYSINLKILRQRAAAGEKLAIAAPPLIPKWKD